MGSNCFSKKVSLYISFRDTGTDLGFSAPDLSSDTLYQFRLMSRAVAFQPIRFSALQSLLSNIDRFHNSHRAYYGIVSLESLIDN